MDKIRTVLRAGVAITLAVVIGGAAVIYVVTDPSSSFAKESWDSSPLVAINEGVRLYDKNGAFMCKVNRNGYGKADISDLADHTKQAFIAVEDARFYEHGAVDVRRMAAALIKDISTLSAKEGASTITQQLAKNTYLSPEKTITRKLKELRIARAIEQRYDKDEILEMYLNSLYFGSNIYGIETASHRFFDKRAADLTLDESAALAAVINNPGRYDPFAHPDAAEARKRLVLSRMEKRGYITAEEREAASRPTEYIYSRYNNKHFVDLSLRDAKHCDVDTMYDAETQMALERALTDVSSSYSGEYTAAALVLDVATGAPVAAASNTYTDLSEERRSPGSTIKPLVCYVPALERGLVSPVTPILDARTNFGGYVPKNYKDEYYGWTTTTECVARSLNIPAIKLLDMVGTEKAKKVASGMGLTFSESDNGLALALGGMTHGATLRELAEAYRVIAAGGCDIIGEDTAYLMTSMLVECAERGTAKELRGCGVAAKTGTVGSPDGDTDAYCISYNPKYVVAVRVSGNKLPEGITGGTMPAEVCRKMMERSESGCGAFTRPKTIVSIEIDARELNDRHRVTVAAPDTLPKDRIAAEFSIYHMPDKPEGSDLPFGDYENFKIVDGFVD